MAPSLEHLEDNPLSVEERLAAHEATRGDRSTFDALLAKGFSAEEARRIIAESDAAGPRVHIAATLYQPGDDEIEAKSAEQQRREDLYAKIVRWTKVDPRDYARAVGAYKMLLWKTLWAHQELAVDDMFPQSDIQTLSKEMGQIANARSALAHQLTEAVRPGGSSVNETGLITPFMRIVSPKGFDFDMVRRLELLRKMREELYDMQKKIGGVRGLTVRNLIHEILSTWGLVPQPAPADNWENVAPAVKDFLKATNGFGLWDKDAPDHRILMELAFLGDRVFTNKAPSVDELSRARSDDWQRTRGVAFEAQPPVRWTGVVSPIKDPPRGYPILKGKANFARLVMDLKELLIEMANVTAALRILQNSLAATTLPHSDIKIIVYSFFAPMGVASIRGTDNLVSTGVFSFFLGPVSYIKRTEALDAMGLELVRLINALTLENLFSLVQTSASKAGHLRRLYRKPHTLSAGYQDEAGNAKFQSGMPFGGRLHITFHEIVYQMKWVSTPPTHYENVEIGPRYVYLDAQIADPLGLVMLLKGESDKAFDLANELIAGLHTRMNEIIDDPSSAEERALEALRRRGFKLALADMFEKK